MKSEVAKREEELAVLKELLDDELVKKSKLTAMVQHYTNPPASTEETSKRRGGVRDRDREREGGWVGNGVGGHGGLGRRTAGRDGEDRDRDRTQSIRAAEGVGGDHETVRTSRTGTSTLKFGSVTTNAISARLSRK